MVKKIAIAAVILIAAFLAYAATKPDTFRVERSESIKAPPEKIFALINDLHSWVFWSPWEKIDPNMTRTYSGAANGKGAVYEWDGNNQVGKGRMEIIESSRPSAITIKLDFIKPFEGHNIAEFTLSPKVDATNVTWSMHGPSPYFAKVMRTIFNMDKMIGNNFEDGLSHLRDIAEKRLLRRSNQIEIRKLPPFHYHKEKNNDKIYKPDSSRTPYRNTTSGS